MRLPPAGEAAAHGGLGAVPRRAAARLRDGPQPARHGRDEPAVGLPEVRLRAPPHAAGRPRASADADGEAVRRFTDELAWREFYADVLWHRPESAREALDARMGAIEVDTGPEADAHFAAWAEGRTGYPIVDAGMRQLLGEAYVHNRVRMIVASFLVKDLHLDWRRGARHFLRHLVDGDLASNNHGWQWVAGTGTDASPYYRVFNPTRQGREFDPDGGYVRRWVPELRDVPDRYVHEPWLSPDGAPGRLPRADRRACGRAAGRPRPLPAGPVPVTRTTCREDRPCLRGTPCTAWPGSSRSCSPAGRCTSPARRGASRPAPPLLDGRVLEDVFSYGKHLFADFGGDTLHVHLGLYGSFTSGTGAAAAGPGARCGCGGRPTARPASACGPTCAARPRARC